MRTWACGVWLLVASLGLGTHAAAQRAGVDANARLLRQAAGLEASGDLEGAERVLREVIAGAPDLPGPVFALERVLGAGGRQAEVLPVIAAFLQRDPGAAEVRTLELRVLSETGSVDTLERKAEAWLTIAGADLSAYREVARVYEQVFGPDRALEALRRGRAVSGRADALALEIGDALARAGDPGAAVPEWVAAVGDDGQGAAMVARRVEELGPEGGDVADRMLEALSGSSVFARRRAAPLMALELGMEDEALEHAAPVAEELGGRARGAFLEDVGERARARGLPALASWAYAALGSDARTPAERRNFDQQLVETALAAGDTTAAADAQWRVVGSLGPGAVDRRRATARAIRLEMTRAEPDRLRRLIDEFAAEFPEAPELDDLAARAAGALQARGDEEGAEAVLERVVGPRSGMERAYLFLAAGQVERARAALMEAVTGMAPSEATAAIQLAGLLGRLSPASAAALGRAAADARQARVEDAVATLDGAADAAPSEDRAALLSEGARLADAAGAPDAAARLRTRILEEHPDDPVAADALLALARYHAGRDGGREQAISILEDLIASRPDAAVVPNARAELSRLRGPS